MENNLRLCKRNRIHLHRIFQWTRYAAAGIALAAGMVGASQAALVTVDGTFLSFTSYMGTDRTSFVNTTALTAGTSISPTRFLSDTVNFTAPTTTITFNYDPTCCGFVPPFPLVNSFEFIPAPQADVNVGDIFQLGTFRFTNGQWWEQADIGFRLTSHSTDPALNNQIFEGTLRLISVSAIPTFLGPTATNDELNAQAVQNAQAEADYFFLLSSNVPLTLVGSGRVYDQFRQFRQPPDGPGGPGFAESFALDGMIGSLIPTGWRALGPAGFTNPSIQPELAGPSTSVPEPATYVMMLTGLGLMGLMARRRKQK